MFKRFTASFVALPDALKVGITAVVVAVLSAVVTNVIAGISFFAFLLPFLPQFYLGVATALIMALEKAIPDALGPVAVKAIELILLVLALFGVGATLTALGALSGLLAFP